MRYQGIKNPRGPGETTGTIIRKDNRENVCIITRRQPFDKGDSYESVDLCERRGLSCN